VVSTTPRPLYPRERPDTHCDSELLEGKSISVFPVHNKYIMDLPGIELEAPKRQAAFTKDLFCDFIFSSGN
jgi:hypothetical protein